MYWESHNITSLTRLPNMQTPELIMGDIRQTQTEGDSTKWPVLFKGIMAVKDNEKIQGLQTKGNGEDMAMKPSSVQSLSHVHLVATPWTAARQAYLSITNSRSPPKPISIKSMMPSNHLIPCHSLLLLPSIFPSIRVFSNESALRIRWPKYWSFCFNISPSKEHPGLISFRMDWMDLLAIQGTLKSLLQHYTSKASILRCSAFFTVQLSHPYMTTGKIIALTSLVNSGWQSNVSAF